MVISPLPNSPILLLSPLWVFLLSKFSSSFCTSRASSSELSTCMLTFSSFLQTLLHRCYRSRHLGTHSSSVHPDYGRLHVFQAFVVTCWLLLSCFDRFIAGLSD